MRAFVKTNYHNVAVLQNADLVCVDAPTISKYIFRFNI